MSSVNGRIVHNITTSGPVDLTREPFPVVILPYNALTLKQVEVKYYDESDIGDITDETATYTLYDEYGSPVVLTDTSQPVKIDGPIILKFTEEYPDSLIFLAEEADGGLVDTIGKVSGPVQPGRGYTGNGTAYISIPDLLTTDTILADSTGQPTCTVNGRLDLANGVIIWGVSVTRNGERIGYFPCAEGYNTEAFNIDGPMSNGIISDESIHTEIVDGTGFDLNQNGFSTFENLHRYSEPENLAQVEFASAGSSASAGWLTLPESVGTLAYTYRACDSLAIPTKFSFLCKMDDGSAPRPGLTLSASYDFRVIVQGTPATDAQLSVDHIVDDIYQITALLTGSATNTSAGIYSYAGNSGKGFSISKMHYTHYDGDYIKTEVFRKYFAYRPQRQRKIPTAPAKIMIAGDSFTARIATQLAVLFPNSTIIDVGVGGWSTELIRNALAANIATHNPDLIILEGGINSAYASVPAATIFTELEDSVDICGDIPVVMTTLPPSKNRLSPAWTPAIQTIVDTANGLIISYASSNGIPVLDLYDLTENADTDELLSLYDYGDGLHQNDTGAKYTAFGYYDLINSTNSGTSCDADRNTLTYLGRLKYSPEIVSGDNWDNYVLKWPICPELITLDDGRLFTAGVANEVAAATYKTWLGDQFFASDYREQIAMYNSDQVEPTLSKIKSWAKIT